MTGKITAVLPAVCFILSVYLCGCGKKSESKEKTVPPPPVECGDPNAVTFDDGLFSFVSIINDDKQSAVGDLSVTEIEGNKMLKFTDDFSVPAEEKVQKLSINAAQLLAPEDLARVRSIEFDLYADAVSKNYTNQDGKKVKAPGTICAGGGTVTAKENDKGEGVWYDFAEFEGGEYNCERSGAVHACFKFLLADSGICWDETMKDANFLVMRWGSENDSNLYIDNIIFYDENGQSIPVDTSEKE